MIIDEIAEHTLSMINEELRTVDIGVSLSYTYCIVEGRYGLALGLAHTTYDRVFHGLRDDFSPTIDDIPKLIGSWKLLEKTIGLAMLNAVSQYVLFNTNIRDNIVNNMFFRKDVLDVINIPLNKNILIVGYIKPIIKRLRDRGYKNIYIVERDPPTRFEDIYSDVVFPRIAEMADVVFITGSTVVNDTLDTILQYSRNAKKILVGPSAQVIPDMLGRHGIDVVASIKVGDVWKVAEVVRKAGGTRAILKYSEKYVYISG